MIQQWKHNWRLISLFYYMNELIYLQEVRQEAGVVRRRWQWLLWAVPPPRETPRNEVWIRLGTQWHTRKCQILIFRLEKEKRKSCTFRLLNVFAHHSKELLWQGIVGEEVKLCGVWGQGWVGGRGIVEPSTQRQVLSKQLHVVLYPL